MSIRPAADAVKPVAARMEDETELATPRPWTALSQSIVTIGVEGKGALATLAETNREGGLVLNREITNANAALIVKAVNQHDAHKMVAAAAESAYATSCRVPCEPELSDAMGALYRALLALRKESGKP